MSKPGPKPKYPFTQGVFFPKFHTWEWMYRRAQVAVSKRQEAEPKFFLSDWLREAVAEKLEREMGPVE